MKGQAALEYLVTYGWAFLVILIVIGGLAYFGVISPNKWIPEKCDLGAQMECVDYQVNLNTHSASLYLRNNFGKSIDITEIQVAKEGIPEETHPGGPTGTIAPGSTISVSDEVPVTEKGKQRFIVKVKFKKTGGTTIHTVTGILYANVQQGSA